MVRAGLRTRWQAPRGTRLAAAAAREKQHLVAAIHLRGSFMIHMCAVLCE
jgi:hypothetical protein